VLIGHWNSSISVWLDLGERMLTRTQLTEAMRTSKRVVRSRNQDHSLNANRRGYRLLRIAEFQKAKQKRNAMEDNDVRGQETEKKWFEGYRIAAPLTVF
jgi:hypothetical protein